MGKNNLQEIKEYKNEEKNTREGRVIKLIELLEAGVIKTKDPEVLFFHIDNFKDENLEFKDIKLGDVIRCEVEVQKSDGKLSAINCERVEIKGYLKKYFIEYTLIALGDVELIDEFYENSKEYANYIVESNIDIKLFIEITNNVLETESIMDIKMIRPKLSMLSNKYSDNETFSEYLLILYEIIKKIDPKSKNDKEIVNFKKFLRTLLSYVKAII